MSSAKRPLPSAAPPRVREPCRPENGEKNDENSGSESEAGPSLPPSSPPSAASAKRRRKERPGAAQREAVALARLPSAASYERSYMHRDHVTHVAIGPSQFLVTGSRDGAIKFWKKTAGGIEFVKLYRAHLCAVAGLAVSANGFLLASVAEDGEAKIFDVLSFDMIHSLRLEEPPLACEWVHPRAAAKGMLAVSGSRTGAVRVYKADAESGAPPALVVRAHSRPVHLLRYNEAAGHVVSADASGAVECWDAATGECPPPRGLAYRFKSDTDLFEFARRKTVPVSLDVSRDGRLVAAAGADGVVRVFRHATGRMVRAYDESPAASAAAQQAGGDDGTPLRLEPIDFGRRMAVERDLDAARASASADARPPPCNAVFDESGQFLVYPTMLGVKVVCLRTNRLARLLGKDENLQRFLRVALFQGIPRAAGQSAEAEAGAGLVRASATAVAAAAEDPAVFCLAFRDERFYWFSRREPADGGSERDVLNERPTRDDTAAAAAASASAVGGPRSRIAGVTGAVLHTTMGDVRLDLFAKDCPRTVENFVVHSREGYYAGTVLHRVIKGFMLQGGDPRGDGTGGESIWGGKFEDEIRPHLRHDRPGTLSMANSGPNTNGSQFFVTAAKTPWLDRKHTVFGRVRDAASMEVVRAIERVETDRRDRPLSEVGIVSVDVETASKR